MDESSRKLLPIDADVLIQVFKTGPDGISLLRLLRDYHLQPAIVEEVERELAWHAKFRDRFDAPTQKALGNGLLVSLDEDTVEKQIEVATNAVAGLATAGAFKAIGADYGKRVGAGEAYTFAAALALNVPAASNDFSAIRTLTELGLAVPAPVLRFFDLVAFAYQAGHMDAAQCNETRRALTAEKETITPRAFQHASFEDGLRQFQPRLVDGNRGRVGRGPSASPKAHETEFVLRKR